MPPKRPHFVLSWSIQNDHNNNYTSAYLCMFICMSHHYSEAILLNYFLKKKYLKFMAQRFFRTLELCPTIFFIAINFDTEILKTSSSPNGDMFELYFLWFLNTFLDNINNYSSFILYIYDNIEMLNIGWKCIELYTHRYRYMYLLLTTIIIIIHLI